MSSVMIRCPTTGDAGSTAIETESSVFRVLPAIAAGMRCPACGQDHVWTVRSAWLATGVQGREMPPSRAA